MNYYMKMIMDSFEYRMSLRNLKDSKEPMGVDGCENEIAEKPINSKTMTSGDAQQEKEGNV